MTKRRRSEPDPTFQRRVREFDERIKGMGADDDFPSIARDYLLAKADSAEYWRFDLAWARIYRERANSESYCAVWAVSKRAEKLLWQANEAHTFTASERAAIEERNARTAAALNGAINALISAAA